MTTNHRFSLLLLCLASIFLATPAEAASPAVIKMIQDKAAISMEKLRTHMMAGDDVSKIVPMMKNVKTLADKGEFDAANRLLDKILLSFSALEMPEMPDSAPVFINPRQVTVTGYKQSVMEAFITGDGQYLFFNNDTGDNPKTDKDIFYARRINDVTFKFMGEIKGVNSAEVDGVPTMDRMGNFYFVSARNYSKPNRFATLYSGKFKDGRVSDLKAHPEVSLNLPGWLNMDVEISADGKTLYTTQTYFSNDMPEQSYFQVAHLKDGKFEIDSHSNAIFDRINTADIEYGASISSDGRELYFTRLTFKNGGKFTSYYATRPDKKTPFSTPRPITAINGYAEAPAITADGRLLYFHKKTGDHFQLYVLERAAN
ncbi:MAG: hypothetical protein L3J50_06300 [Emcibacter sp.]|nr:hypothetical protein [Emcibacter sp.]